MMDVNIEELITHVKQHPVIWDHSCEDYPSKLKKRTAWEDVIIKFYPDYHEESELEKNSIERAIQRKWKSLRDCYSRELSKIKADNAKPGLKRQRKQYMYFKQLRFLGRALKSTSGIDNIEDLLLEAIGPVEEKVDSSRCAPRRMKLRNAKEPVIEEPLIVSQEKCKKDESQGAQGLNNDEDRLFMLSLVPELKKIPDYMKLETKCEILNVIKRARHQLLS